MKKKTAAAAATTTTENDLKECNMVNMYVEYNLYIGGCVFLLLRSSYLGCLVALPVPNSSDEESRAARNATTDHFVIGDSAPALAKRFDRIG